MNGSLQSAPVAEAQAQILQIAFRKVGKNVEPSTILHERLRVLA
jgi:hypothetical protein